MKLLLHTCCAVCLAGTALETAGRKLALTAFYHNPNVHPLLEWRKRLKATQVMCERLKLPLVADGEYGLDEFLKALQGRHESPARCETCYRLRLGRTADRAKALGFDAFSTPLLASPEQDLALIRRVAQDESERAGVAFEDLDLAGAHDRGKEFAKKHNIYRQQYCGCVFSEYDRYKDTRDELWRGE